MPQINGSTWKLDSNKVSTTAFIAVPPFLNCDPLVFDLSEREICMQRQIENRKSSTDYNGIVGAIKSRFCCLLIVCLLFVRLTAVLSLYNIHQPSFIHHQASTDNYQRCIVLYNTQRSIIRNGNDVYYTIKGLLHYSATIFASFLKRSASNRSFSACFRA